MALIRPLVVGDLIAVVGPAGVLPERFARQAEYVLEHLEILGFRTLNLLGDEHTDTPAQRAVSLAQAFAHPAVKAVLPLCGGKAIHETIRLLPERLEGASEKLFCGSSELSALNLALEQRGISCFFGPHLPFLHPKASFQERHFTVRSFWNMLMRDWHGKNGLDQHERHHFFRAPPDSGALTLSNIYREPSRIRNVRCRDVQYITHYSGPVVRGRLMPMSLMAFVDHRTYCDTTMQRGDLLRFDCLDQSHESILQDLSTLLDENRFPEPSGVFFTSCVERSDRKERRFLEFSDEATIRSFLVSVERLLRKRTPVFYGFPAGHCAYKLTLPVGCQAAIDPELGSIEIVQPFYKL